MEEVVRQPVGAACATPRPLAAAPRAARRRAAAAAPRAAGRGGGAPGAPGFFPLKINLSAADDPEVRRILAKYAPGVPAPRGAGGAAGTLGDGTYALLLLNFALHAAAALAGPRLPWLAGLALSHACPRWWQFVTCAFVHANWEHLFGESSRRNGTAASNSLDSLQTKQ
jgi:hypothetical protein